MLELSKCASLHHALMLTTAIALAPALSQALPTGGQVSSGSATITNVSPTQTQVNQSSKNAVINWTGFNTANGEQVNFNDAQGSSSVTLNRVSGAATNFNGALTSNGNVWVVNPNGVVIGQTGKVNTAGFLATTSAITDANFMAGNYNFTPGGGAATATVSNEGTISVANSGLAALVAPNVSNSGSINLSYNTIQAKAGTIALASGDTFAVDLAGDGLINLAASNAVTRQTLNNTGGLYAGSTPLGNVVISAAQASNVLNNVINLDGVVQATNVTGTGDAINYGAAYAASPGSSFTLTAPGNITVAGGSTIGAANNAYPVNVSLNSVSGSVNVGAAAINTGGGALSITAENPQNYQINQSVSLNGTAISTNGGDVSVVDNGAFTAQNGSISQAGNVSIQAVSDSYLPTGIGYGASFNKFTIDSKKGDISIEGAAGTPTGASVGLSVSGSTFTAENGGIGITGLSGSTTDGASTALSVNGSYLNAATGGIYIQGLPTGLIGAKVQGGSADGVVITQSVIGGATTKEVDISGKGGNASGYASEGIVMDNTSVTSSGKPYTYTYTPSPVYPGGPTNPVTVTTDSGVTLVGTGGTGTNTTGVDASGGRLNLELANTTQNGFISITGTGGKSSGTGADAGVVFAGNVYSNLVSDNLSIMGTGGSGTNSVNGSGVSLAAVNTQAVNTTLTGQGGTGVGAHNYGIQLAGAVNIYDNGTFQVTGTGVGSAADLESNESADSSLNNFYLAKGASISDTATRNMIDLKDITITQE